MFRLEMSSFKTISPTIFLKHNYSKFKHEQPSICVIINVVVLSRKGVEFLPQISISLKPDGLNISYFKFRLFDSTKIIV